MADRDLLAELDALGEPQTQDQQAEQADPAAEWEEIRRRRRARAGQPEPAAPDPSVGTSDLARELTQEGYFDELTRQFTQGRQQREQEAIEQSQGWSVDSVATVPKTTGVN
jgi:hypothetical protein